jgi:hypothetical protein
MASRISWKARFSSLLNSEGLSAYDRNVIVDMKAGYDRKSSSYMTSGRKRYFLAIESMAADTLAAMEERALNGKSNLAIRLEEVRGYIIDSSSWAAGFIESLIGQEQQRGRLSSSQLSTLVSIERENNPETVALSKDWHARFATDTEAQTQWHHAMIYYRANPPYHNRHVQDWFALDDIDSLNGRLGTEIAIVNMPSRKDFTKVMSNNYIKKVLAGYAVPPLFEAGAMVTLRASANYTAKGKTNGKPCVVMTGKLDIITASKGNRRYRLLPVGSTQTFEIQEKHIKSFRIPKTRR